MLHDIGQDNLLYVLLLTVKIREHEGQFVTEVCFSERVKWSL